MGSAEFSIPIDEDEGFSDTMTPENAIPQHLQVIGPRPALHSIGNLQNCSAVRQLFD